MFICPVLGRPHLADNLLSSWRALSVYPLTLLTYADDPERDAYHALLHQHQALDGGHLLNAIDIPRATRGTCSALNYYFRLNPDRGYYGFIGEDCVLKTPNLPLVPMSCYFAISWPDDGMRGPTLCTHPVLGGELVRDVGYLALPTLFHSFFDNVWHCIGQALDILHYEPSVEYQHNHPLTTGRSTDHVSEIVQRTFEADEAAFQKWRLNALPKLINRLT